MGIRDIEGAIIAEVVENGPAERSGLKGFERTSNGNVEMGDIIIGIGEEKVDNYDEVLLALEKYRVGDKVKVIFLRNNDKKETVVTLGELM